MSEKERQILIDLGKITKSWAVRHQSYECAAQSRDLEKYLERSDCFSDSAEEFFNKIKIIFDTLGKINQVDQEYLNIQEKFELQKNYIFRQLRRQDLLNKLFGDVD
jgi:hypothetical protein